MVDRFDEDVVGAELDGLDPVLHAVERRHHDDRNEPGLLVSLEHTANREPVHQRHHDVEQDQVGRAARHFLERFDAVSRALGAIAVIFELLLEVVGHETIVVDDENLRRRRHHG